MWDASTAKSIRRMGKEANRLRRDHMNQPTKTIYSPIIQRKDNNICQEYKVLVVEKVGQDNTKKDGKKNGF